jgi:hypothetical protein
MSVLNKLNHHGRTIQQDGQDTPWIPQFQESCHPFDLYTRGLRT